MKTNCTHPRQIINGICPDCSVLKLAISIPGREMIYKYSFYKYNHKPVELTMAGMEKRLATLLKQASKYIFYNNITGEVIKEISCYD